MPLKFRFFPDIFLVFGGILMKNWTIEELKELYDLSLMELISKAHHIHAKFHKVSDVQVCTLISVKTGGCPEDCKYCAQSSSYQTPVSPQKMMSYSAVIAEAKKAIARGATRICLGAAWREVREGKPFDEMLQIIRGIRDLGVEVCCTLGMLQKEHARRLKEAGVFAYSHNLDTSERFYPSIITTRTYQDRLKTLDIVAEAGISVCCGGILGMGETIEDRLELLLTLASRNPPPDSVPLNALSQVPGTPLQDCPKISPWEMIRIVAIARIVLPKARVRLSAGRNEMSLEEQALCFLAGANSIHSGEKLLTVANTPLDSDAEMFQILGLK
jgi:biotin synthase